MLKKQNIICISSIDWDFIWQGHQEIMSTFAKNGNRILFIENTGVRTLGIRDLPRIKKRVINWLKGIKGIRKEMESLYIFSPLVLPFPYSRLARWINRHSVLSILERWIKVMDFSDPIVWTFLPTPLSLDIIDNLIKKLVIYYCIDDFSVSSVSARKIRKSEIRLLKKVDLVFVTSGALCNHCSKYNDSVYTFPFAVNFNEFENVRLENDSTVEELRDIKRPIVGYVGGVHKWIDQKLVKALAERYSGYSFVFVGPLQTDISLLSDLKNVYFLGNKDHKKLPLFIKNFDLCIIPYLITNYTKNVYPTKLNEYLAMGKPVVSTDLPEIEMFNKRYVGIVYIGRNPEEFGGCIEEAIKEDNEELRKRRIEVARENSWENRIEQMSDLIQEAIKIKMSDREARWKENLLSFYRTTRRRLMRIGAVCLIAYLLFFKTSFVWFLAAPLKITDIPQKADAIVVFAGGVGESGKAGQGYEERVQYAVELYKRGYAGNLIFSSGYVYALREAEIMKILAVSMDVPKGAILLEEKAANTYENAKFTKKILEGNGWDSILLVSSPYHMRRVKLVYKKVAPEIKVSLTPVSNSLFYGNEKEVKMKHIKAIVHEYLGIIYYWWKGYI